MISKVFAAAITFIGMVEWTLATRQPVEIDVATLVGDRISDVDDGAIAGVAIIDHSDGWEFSLNDRATWQPVPENDSLLLNLPAWLRNDRPLTVGEQSPWLEYRAWDQTQGVIGQTFAIADTGGETAFSVNSLPVVFTLADVTVDEDRRRRFGIKALSQNGNVAALTNVTYTITPPEIGTWQDRAVGDPPNVAGYFVPSGQLGTCTLSVSGTNKRGQQVTPGTITIEVVVGAAQVIVVEDLGEVD